MKLTKKEVIRVLENLVHSRFTIKSLEEHLSKAFNTPIKLDDISSGDDELADYNLLGLLDVENRAMYCFFDIYFLKMRRKGFDGANIYVTEVAYQFE